MPNIKTTPSAAYPSIPDVGDTLESHGEAIQAITDSLETGERRDGNYLESFITFQELVTLGIIDERGEFVLSLGDVDLGVLNSITDVTITGVTDNEVLAYDVGSSEWINQTPSQAGLAAASHTHVESEITDLQPYLINISGQLLGSLNDVVLADPPLDKEFLVFDLATGDWINQTSTELGISGVDPGTVTDAVLRWSGSEWIEETGVKISSAGDLTVTGAGDSSFVGSVGIGTIMPIEALDVVGNVRTDRLILSRGGAGVEEPYIEKTGNKGIGFFTQATVKLDISVGGVFDFQAGNLITTGAIFVGDIMATSYESILAANLLSRIVNEAVAGDWKFDGQIIIKERATAPVGESAYGVIWVKNTIPNELWFTNDASQDFLLVSDVVSDASPQLGGNLASNGFDILMADNDKVIFGDGADMQMYNIGGTATSRIDNLNANAILEFSFTGGLISFDGLNDRVDIRDGWRLRIRNSLDLDWADFWHDGTDFNTDFENTADWNITGINGGRLKIHGPNAGLHLRDGGLFTIFSVDNVNWVQMSQNNTECTLSAFGGTNVISSLRLDGVAVATLNTNWSAADITSGTLAVLRGGTGVTTKTGTGSVVLHTAPTFSGKVTIDPDADEALLLTPDTTSNRWGMRIESSNATLNDSGFWSISSNWGLILRDAGGAIDVHLKTDAISTIANGLNISGGALQVAGVAVATLNTNWAATDITSGTLAVLRGGTGVTTKTGTGSVVLSALPVFTGTSHGSNVGASVTDLSKHLALWGTSYGVNVTPSNLNLVASGVNFLSSTTLVTTSKVVHNFIGLDTKPAAGISALSANMLHIDGKEAIDGNDTWLRLNENGDFANGIYCRLQLRVDGNINANGNIVGDGGTVISGIETLLVDATGDITKVSHGNYLYHQSTVYDDDQEGGITFSTSGPSGGADGDIWFEYTA